MTMVKEDKWEGLLITSTFTCVYICVCVSVCIYGGGVYIYIKHCVHLCMIYITKDVESKSEQYKTTGIEGID